MLFAQQFNLAKIAMVQGDAGEWDLITLFVNRFVMITLEWIRRI